MASFFDLTSIKDPYAKEEAFIRNENRFEMSDKSFAELEGIPYNAYWLGKTFIKAFTELKLSEYAKCCTGMQTGGNAKYIRLWFEVNINETTIFNDKAKYEKYNCGGENRRWYGNHFNVVDWSNNGAAIRAEKSSVIRNERYFRKEGISWKRIAGDVSYIRYLPEGFIFDQAGDSMFPFEDKNLFYILGFLNSKVAMIGISFIAPTMNLTAGNMNKLPVILDEKKKERIDNLVGENIDYCKQDWDMFETSWDFRRHPLI